LVGTYQKSDQATMDKTRLGYARVMVELTVGNKFPSKVRFRDETGNINTSDKSTKTSSLVRTQQPDNGENASTSLVTPEKSYREAAEGPNHTKGIGLFGLLETKISSNKTQSVSAAMLDGWSVTTNASYHKGGRVWLLWKADLYDVFILQYDAQFVHALVTEKCSQEQFYITMVYAFNDGTERRYLWMKLILLHGAVAGPWVVAGDFNTVINPLERLGGNTKQSDMDDFIDCLATCELTDIHTTGAYYTWTNKQEAQTRVYSRLDRFLINQDWFQGFPNMTAHFHPSGYFDHCPCVVSDNQLTVIRKTNFKYFNMWSKASSFLTTVQEEWQRRYEGYPMYCVTRKMKALKGRLKELNKECFSDVENAAILAEKTVLKIQGDLIDDPLNAELIQEEITALKSFKDLNDARQSYLRQKAKTQWLEDGDANSAYFHGAIKKRCSINKVTQIEDHQGNICTTSQSIQDAFLNYDQELLGTSNPTDMVRQQVINTGKCCIEAHKEILNKPVTTEEIKEAFFQVPIDKSPGLDGYTIGFFKDSWDIVGNDVCFAIQDFFSTVISKLLCNRLSMVLPDLVSENQGAFIKGRSIIENILICQDLFKMYNRQAVSPRCLFKIDLQKAYDTVEWNFVAQLLEDDLLMFCKGNVQSIMLMMRAFSSFSKASGLSMNSSKSEVYYSGVSQTIKDDIRQITGFTEGSMPFRYLEVPVQATRLTKIECNILVEKMVNRIRSLGAKKLSYAGRLVLVNSVLNTLHNYCSGIFLIPKCVVKRIEAVCRNYLWDGTADFRRVPSVGWDKVHIKGKNWHDYLPPADVAWSWKNVCKVKELVKNAYVEDQWMPDDKKGFTIETRYEWLRHRASPQNWAPAVWNTWNVPKHSFITWVSMNNGLNTRAKLASFRYCQEHLCCICEISDETQAHLFFQCAYSQRVLQEVKKWCGFCIDVNMAALASPDTRIKGLKQLVHCQLWASCHYHVWLERNSVRVNAVVTPPIKLAERIIAEAKTRIMSMVGKSKCVQDSIWLRKWGCLVI
ncbi:uncharacterized protein LOC141639928, partial [Silene latifolia]|uniref:uncharacterized protein LOC141639928 n=1 Tax=Silene latifolia TaxID=37657 RepID=UPI003D7752EE